MSKERRSYTPKEVEKILLSKGFALKRQTGGHRIYYHAVTKATVVVPFHSRDIPRGTLRSIVQQAKLKMREFQA
jgi:predicted RNA binding protein YcfA (HicA-like mRNA interferase family)